RAAHCSRLGWRGTGARHDHRAASARPGKRIIFVFAWAPQDPGAYSPHAEKKQAPPKLKAERVTTVHSQSPANRQSLDALASLRLIMTYSRSGTRCLETPPARIRFGSRYPQRE